MALTFGSSGLSLAQLQSLKTDDPSFFDQEANVNGMWFGFIAAFFHSNSLAGPSYLIAPESVAPGGSHNLRADFNVLQLSPARPQNNPPPYITLTYEGKRANEGRQDLDTVTGQLQTYVANANVPPASGRTFYAIAAVGTKFKLFAKLQATSMMRLNIQDNGPIVALRDAGRAAHNAYDVVDHYGLLVHAIDFMARHTYPSAVLF